MLELSGGQQGRLEFAGALAMSRSGTLYTSGVSGQEDTVRIIYSLSGLAPVQSGTYTGTLLYQLYTLDGGSSDQITVSLRVSVAPMASIDFSERSARGVILRGLIPGERAAPLVIDLAVNSNTSSTVQVEQRVEEPLTDGLGHTLPLTALDQWVSSAGELLRQGSLEPRITLNLNHTAGESRSLALSYLTAVPQGQPAGTYAGVLSVRLNNAGLAAEGAEGFLRIPIQIEVIPVLTLSVRSSGGGEPQLRFTYLKPGDTSDPLPLVLEIQTNLTQPYEIVQELSAPLTNENGRQLPAGAFSCTASVTTTGALTTAQDAPVAVGRSRIYRSGDAGQPTAITVLYRLSIPSDAAAGAYTGTLTFTLIPS
jgi:hypothetical protein